MTTLAEQIGSKVADFTGFERQASQEINVIDRKMATNGSGAEFILVEFISTGHPLDTSGLRVVSIVEDYIYDIDANVKAMFPTA